LAVGQTIAHYAPRRTAGDVAEISRADLRHDIVKVLPAVIAQDAVDE
jgi:hypothetical protein